MLEDFNYVTSVLCYALVHFKGIAYAEDVVDFINVRIWGLVVVVVLTREGKG